MIVKRHILTGALRIAAGQYLADAEAHRFEPAGGEGLMNPSARARLVGTFEWQAAQALALADAIEQGVQITLED